MAEYFQVDIFKLKPPDKKMIPPLPLPVPSLLRAHRSISIIHWGPGLEFS